MIPILGFSPDADQTTPGVISDCTNFVPYINGMEGGPSASTPTGVSALAAACKGAAVVTKLDDTRRIFAGTQTKLYELSSGSWTDRTRAVGGDYTGGSDNVWSIAQFGDATLCANRADEIQRSTSGAFANISGSPDAKIIFTVGAFVMALNVNDGAEKPDGWHCCAAYDDTDWTEAIATQCASGRLVATAGAINAGARLGEYAIAYKSGSIFLGRYVGPPSVWDWVQVPGGEAGCVGQNAICDIGGAHFFVGDDNFWIFDGTSPKSVGDNTVRQWFANNSSPTYRYKTTCVFEKHSNRVWVFFPSQSSSSLDRALVYDVISKRWGRADRQIEAAMSYISPAQTIDGLTGTIDTLPDVSFDSQYWLSGGRSLSIFNTSHQLQSLTGVSDSSDFTTGDNGDDEGVSLLTQIRLRYAGSPATASATAYSRMNLGDDQTEGDTTSIDDGKFDVLQSARWHRAKFSFTGNVKVTGLSANLRRAGKR